MIQAGRLPQGPPLDVYMFKSLSYYTNQYLHMKLTSFAFATAALFLAATACNNAGETKVKAFADNFAKHVSENQRDSVILYYPAAEYADEFAIGYNPDSITVKSTDKENVYLVTLGDGATITVTLSPEGKVKVNESHGLFRFPASKLDFARKTGALRSGINDERLAQTMLIVDNMATELFNDYVAKRKNAVKNLGVTITKDIEFMMEQGRGHYTLKNTSDQPIAAGDYSVTWEDEWYYAENEGSKKRIEQGKQEIPANGTITLPFTFNGHSSSAVTAVTVNTPTQEDFFKNYKPTGQEYSIYVKAHGDEPVKAGHLSNGPYQLAGNLGAKLAIHINLDKGMKQGTYYYDKYGPKNTLDLSVKAFNDHTGELTLEECNDKGEVTGSFVGKLTADTYTGTMTAYTGKSYPFTLKVIK